MSGGGKDGAVGQASAERCASNPGRAGWWVAPSAAPQATARSPMPRTRGMLVHNEQVPAQTGNDEAQVELAQHLWRGEG